METSLKLQLNQQTPFKKKQIKFFCNYLQIQHQLKNSSNFNTYPIVLNLSFVIESHITIEHVKSICILYFLQYVTNNQHLLIKIYLKIGCSNLDNLQFYNETKSLLGLNTPEKPTFRISLTFKQVHNAYSSSKYAQLGQHS